MERLKYRLCTEVNRGTEEEPQIEQIFSDVSLGYSSENEELAKREAYNGEYTIEDDGEPAPAPTEAEQMRADIDFLLAMGGVL